MPQDPISDYVRTSLESVGAFTEDNGLLGRPIETPSGVCVIPVSQVKIAFATGNLDFSAKRNMQEKNNGGGGGTMVTVSPIAYLTVSRTGQTTFIPVNGEPAARSVDKITDVIENAPDILRRIKEVLF